MKFLLKKLRQKWYGLPKIVSFEPIAACPLNCEFCMLKKLEWNKHREKTVMRFGDFRKVIDDIKHFTTRISFSGGEPLLNKELPLMLDYARFYQINTLVATNAVFLYKHREQLIQSPPDQLLVAYDPPSKGYHHTVLNSIRWIVENREKFPQIILQMVLTKQNIDKMGVFYETANYLRADYTSVKALGVWPEGDEEYDRMMIEKYIIPKSEHPISRHEIINGKIVFYRKPGQCPAVKHASVQCDGWLSPCWYWAIGPTMGNVFKDNFVDVWNSYRGYRDLMKYDWADKRCYRCIGVEAKRWFK